MGSMPVVVLCPLTSSLGEFPDYQDWLWYPGLLPVLVSIALSFAFHISVLFHPLFFTCHWISFLLLLYGRRICTHSVDPSLTRLLGEFPGLRLALVSDVVVPEAEQRCALSRNLNQNSALAGIEPRTLASSGRKRYH